MGKTAEYRRHGSVSNRIESMIHSSIHLIIQPVFPKYLCPSRHCAGCWGYYDEQDRLELLPYWS